MELKGKRILVVGLGRSGAGAANLLSILGADVTVTDKKRKEQLGGFLDGISPSVNLSLGEYPESLRGMTPSQRAALWKGAFRGHQPPTQTGMRGCCRQGGRKCVRSIW